MVRATFFTLVVLLSSCTSNKQTPVQYNDSLVIEQVKVVDAADRLQEVFDTYVKEDMETVYGRFKTQIDASIEKVNSIDPYKDDDSFKNSTLELLNTYKRLSENEYRNALEVLSKPDSVYTPADEARLEILYKQIDRVTTQAGAAYIKSQEAFAKANNLSLKLPEKSDSIAVN